MSAMSKPEQGFITEMRVKRPIENVVVYKAASDKKKNSSKPTGL